MPVVTCPKLQRKYICGTITELAHDDILSVYRFVNMSVYIKFNIHGNGCSLNLDDVPNNIVQLIYDIVWNKRNE
jgi:hypothetical protein